MFLATEPARFREVKIKEWLRTDPSVALLVAAVHFEWTVFRAVIFLSPRPNRDIRQDFRWVHGLKQYKDIWREEVVKLCNGRTLPTVVGDWNAVIAAFEARNLLAHGRDRYTRNMATPHVEGLLSAAADVRGYCSQMGIDFQSRLPVRKKMRGGAAGKLTEKRHTRVSAGE